MLSQDLGLTWHDVAIAGAIILSALIAYIVNVFTKRLDQHEETDTTRFTKLFEKQSEIVTTVATGFRQLDQTINNIHVKLLEQINKPHHRQDDT